MTGREEARAGIRSLRLTLDDLYASFERAVEEGESFSDEAATALVRLDNDLGVLEARTA